MELPKYPEQYPPPGFLPEYVQAAPPMVVTTQPTIVIKPQPVYKDYLTWSIVNMICCCLPLGITALVFSRKTRYAMQRQDLQVASWFSRSAFNFNLAATVIGLCIKAAWIGFLVYYFKAGGQSYIYDYY